MIMDAKLSGVFAFIFNKFILFSIIYLFFICFSFIYKNFIRRRKNLGERYGFKTWVLVTGASDGIGKALCHEFAREGFNIILVSRNKEKLKKVCENIETSFRVKTHFIVFDFSKKNSLEDYLMNFGNLINDYEISILVNNVGTNIRGYMRDLPLKTYEDIININILPQTYLTKIFADSMIKRTKRSAIIDLSSISSTDPSPYRAIYTATKSFNYLLSNALADEYENFNIDFMCVRPFLVETSLTKMKSGFLVITAEQCAKGSINDLGYENLTNGHWIHKIHSLIFENLPQFIRMFIFNKVFLNKLKEINKNDKNIYCDSYKNFY